MKTFANPKTLDWDQFVKNQSELQPSDLLPLFGHWVAWSLDGSHAVAHHEDLQEAIKLAEAAGFNREEVIFDRLPKEGEAECLL